MDSKQKFAESRLMAQARESILNGLETGNVADFLREMAVWSQNSNYLSGIQKQAYSDISTAIHIRWRAEKIFLEESGRAFKVSEKPAAIMKMELSAILEQMDWERAHGNLSWQSKVAGTAYKVVSGQLF